MQYTLSRLPKGNLEVKVEIPASIFDESYKNVLENLGKDVQVDGFRPGQVPQDVLESKVGTSKILNEAASFLVNKHLADIFEKEKITPIVNPKIAVDSLAQGKPLHFVATIVERPKVKVGDWKKIKLTKIKAKEVTDEDVEKSIENIFEAWKKSEKDKVTKESEEPKEPEDKFIYDAQGNKRYIQEGSKETDESKEPGVNDEFAQKIGARDLTHLRELVRKDLETIVTDQVEARFEEELFDEILKGGEVEVPDLLIDDEVNRIMVRLNQQLEQQKRKIEDLLREENTTLDALRAKWRPQAEKNVKVTFIMDEIGKEEKIQITKEEIEDATKGVDQANLTEAQKIDMRAYLAVSIFQAKTLNFVKKTISAQN